MPPTPSSQANRHHAIRGVYAITDASVSSTTLKQQVTQALQAGISLLQYRRKQLANLAEAQQLLRLCESFKVPLIINDDIDLAAELGCGVHVGKDDAAVNLARVTLGEQAIVGASCYNSIERAEAAVAAGASYCAFGTVYTSTTKPAAERVTLSTLQQAAKQLAVPTVAIGGINSDNVAAVLQTGVDSVAIINALWRGTTKDDIAANVQAIQQHFNLPSI